VQCPVVVDKPVSVEEDFGAKVVTKQPMARAVAGSRLTGSPRRFGLSIIGVRLRRSRYTSSSNQTLNFKA
jgi:hypothetical protein